MQHQLYRVSVCALLSTLLAAWEASDFIEAGEIVLEGPVEVGDGLPNGFGATLGRVLFRFKGLGAAGDEDLPIDLSLSSSLVRVEPTTCSTPSESPCPEPGRGVAGVMGYPTSAAGSIFRLKLAGARYLPPRLSAGLAGSSLEVAFEGALTVEGEARVGSAVRLRLLVGQLPNLVDWAGDSTRPPAERVYRNNTGAGLLLGDAEAIFFPGTVEGEVVENNGNTLLVKLTKADILTLDASLHTSSMSLTPDPAAASDAGLPAGSFGLLEINYSGFPTRSRIFSPANSNDVELHTTAVTVDADLPFFVRGDCNADGSVTGTVSDAVFLLTFNFIGGEKPPCLEACDGNGDGSVLGNATDAIYLMTFNFLGGPRPPQPFPACGLVQEPRVGCESYPPCNDG